MKITARGKRSRKILFKEIREILSETEKRSQAIIAVSPSVFNGGDGWNEGVIGLVAGKLSDEYYRPVMVITKSGEEIKGSGRSIEEFDIMGALEKGKEHLDRFGGHAGACGFRIKDGDINELEQFIAVVKKFATDKLKDADLRPKLKIEAAIALSELGEETLNEIESLAPLAGTIRALKLLSRGAHIVDIWQMGADKEHMKLRIKDDNSAIFSALGFRQSADWQHLQIGDKIDIVYYPEMNEYNGRREVQLKIVDIKESINEE